MATQYSLNFPGQICHIANGSAHALAQKRRRLVGRITRQQQAALAPALGNDRVKGVDHRAFDLGMLGRYPGPHQFPQPVWLHHGGQIITRHQHDFPAAAVACDIAIRHGPGRVAMLHGVVGQGGRTLFQQRVKYQPGLVQAQIFHGAGQHPANQRAGTVAAHDIARADVCNLT